MSPELIKKLKKSSDFQEFAEYLLGVIDRLDSLTGFDSGTSNERLGEVLRARMEAKDILYEILEPFIVFQEKRKPSEKEKKEAMKRFGL